MAQPKQQYEGLYDCNANMSFLLIIENDLMIINKSTYLWENCFLQAGSWVLFGAVTSGHNSETSFQHLSVAFVNILQDISLKTTTFFKCAFFKSVLYYFIYSDNK